MKMVNFYVSINNKIGVAVNSFKLRARLLKLLGEELIGSSHLAIF